MREVVAHSRILVGFETGFKIGFAALDPRYFCILLHNNMIHASWIQFTQDFARLENPSNGLGNELVVIALSHQRDHYKHTLDQVCERG